MNSPSDRNPANTRQGTPATGDEAARRAAALQALSKAQPAQSAGATFWERHGGSIVLGGILLVGLVLVALAVGKFLRTSISETSRAEQELRRGLH
jgi:hypothetical protein